MKIKLQNIVKKICLEENLVNNVSQFPTQNSSNFMTNASNNFCSSQASAYNNQEGMFK